MRRLESRLLRTLVGWLGLVVPAALSASSLNVLPQDPGFVHFYNNEYDQALAQFQGESESRPNDPLVYNSIAQAILYREMYRDGSLESQLVTGANAFLRRPKMEVSAADRTRFAAAIDRSIELSEQRLAQNKADVNALYAMAVAHGLRANYLFLVEKSWVQALHEAIAGRKANDKILEIAPQYSNAHLIHGLVEYVVSCMPGYMRLLGTFNGFHGDKEGGIRELQQVADSGASSRFDAAILLSAIYRREHRPHDALPLLNAMAATFPKNYLFRFEEVQMYSDMGEKSSALQVLAEIETSLQSRAPGFAQLPVERVAYARGNLLFWYGDLKGSLDNLKTATRGTDELDLSTAVMAWLRLGQVYDLVGDRPNAEVAYRQAMMTAPDSAAAREADGYIERPYRRKA